MDYFNHCCVLSLKCKDWLSEASVVEMCTPRYGMGLTLVLQMSNPQNFQELAIKAHDMEVTIANRRGTSFGFDKSKKDKAEFKRNIKYCMNFTKEAISVFQTEPVRITGKPRQEEKRSASFKDVIRRHPTLKEL